MRKIHKMLSNLSNLRLALLLAGIFVGLVLVIYIGFSVFFMKHFYLNTTINGMKVAGSTAVKVQEMAEEGVKAYTLTFTDRSGATETIAGTDFSLEENYNGGMEALIDEQNGFSWIRYLFSENPLETEAVVQFDEEQLRNCIAELSFMDPEKQIAAVDASISDYSETDGFTLVPSREGTQINEEILYAAVMEAIYGLEENISLEDAGCYLEPAVKDDDEKLLAAIDQMNYCVNASITYQVGQSTQILDASVFADWLVLSDGMEVSIDEEKLSEYVSSLSSTYNTCYSAKTLKTTWGETVKITNVHYGWKVDQDAEKAQIKEELLAGKAVTRDLNYSMTANSHEGNDYGDSYVEINLTAQHLYMYKDGKLVVDSDFVSGSVAAKNDTPEGAFTLTYKQKDATLKGDGYATPVNYWMPFYGNYGMHDATWRSSFGGNIYKTSGSHGCVNLPKSAAETIFNAIEKGYPVLVYKLAGTESETAKAQDAASAVTSAIKKAVGSDAAAVTLDQASAIAEARSKYDALSSTAKAYVKNYDLLTAAEARIAALQEAEAAANFITGDDNSDTDTGEAGSSSEDSAQ